jgi:hypothetical protein
LNSTWSSTTQTLLVVKGLSIGAAKSRRCSKPLAQRFQYAPIVDRMDVAADDSRQCPHMRSIIDMGRQQSGRWIAFFQPLDDGW